jgi:hypothetical protein
MSKFKASVLQHLHSGIGSIYLITPSLTWNRVFVGLTLRFLPMEIGAGMTTFPMSRFEYLGLGFDLKFEPLSFDILTSIP